MASDNPLDEFDDAIAEIANKYGVDEERVQSIIDSSPTLSTFDPDDPGSYVGDIDFGEIAQKQRDAAFAAPTTTVGPTAPGQPASSLTPEIAQNIADAWMGGSKYDGDDGFGWGDLIQPAAFLLKAIDTPRAAVVSGVKELGDLFDPNQQFSFNELYTQARDGIGFGDVIQEWAPGLGEVELFGVKPLDNIAGFVGDVFFDPFTWLTLGTLPLAKQGTMGLVRAALQAGDANLARRVFNSGARAASADDLARVTASARSLGTLKPGEAFTGGLQFRVPFGKTASRLTPGPAQPYYMQVLSHDNKLLRLTPRFAANTIAQKLRRSALGGIVGGDRKTLKKLLRDNATDDELFEAAFHAMDATNIARGVARNLQNTLERQWTNLSRKLLDANISGKQAYDALGADVAPAGFPPELWDELTDFVESVRVEANTAVHINKFDEDAVIPDWIRFREGWQPSVPSAEISMWHGKARTNYAKDQTYLASFEKRAKIVPGEDFMGLTLVKQSEHPKNLTPREQAFQQLEDVMVEQGEQVYKWFDEDLYSAMPQHLGILSRRVEGKFAENYLREMGVVLERAVRDDAAHAAGKAARDIERRLQDLHAAHTKQEAVRDAATLAADDADAAAKKAAADAQQARRDRMAFDKGMTKPVSGRPFREAGDELVVEAEEVRAALNALRQRADDGLARIESAARSSERAAQKYELEYQKIKEGLSELARRRDLLYRELGEIGAAVDDGLEVSTEFLERVDVINTEIRELNDVIAQAEADYFLALGDGSNISPQREAAENLVREGTAASNRAKRAAQLLEQIYRLSPEEEAVFLDPLNRELLPLLDNLPNVPKRAIGRTEAREVRDKVLQVKRGLDEIVVNQKKVVATADEALQSPLRARVVSAREKRDQLKQELDEIVEFLGEEFPPELQEEMKLAIDRLAAIDKGYLTYGNDQMVWFHGVGADHNALDLNARPTADQRVTQELDSYLGIHLAQNVQFSFAGFAGADPRRLTGFMVRSDNPAVYGGSIEDVYMGRPVPDSKAWNERRRGSGLAALHAQILDSAFRNGHYGLEDMKAAGIPYAEQVYISMTGKLPSGAIVGRPKSYLEAAFEFAEPAARDVHYKFVDDMFEQSGDARILEALDGVVDASNPIEAHAQIVDVLRGLAQQNNDVVRRVNTDIENRNWFNLFDEFELDEEQFADVMSEIRTGLENGVRYNEELALEGSFIAPDQAILDNAGGFFDDFVYPITQNKIHVDKSAVEKDEILSRIVGDFISELRAQGHDSIMYTIRHDAGTWAVIPLSSSQLELPTSDSLFKSAVDRASLESSFGARFEENYFLTTAAERDYESYVIESERIINSQSLLPGTREVVARMRETAGLYHDADTVVPGNIEILQNRLLFVADELEEVVGKLESRRGFNTSVTPDTVKSINQWRGRAGQLLGAWRRAYDNQLRAMGLDPDVDLADFADEISNEFDVLADMAEAIQLQEQLLRDTLRASQQINLAFSTAADFRARQLRSVTGSEFVQTIQQALEGARARRLELMGEKLEEIEALGPIGKNMQGDADQARAQAMANRSRVRNMEREMESAQRAVDDEAFELEQKELALRNTADELYREADRIDSKPFSLLPPAEEFDESLRLRMVVDDLEQIETASVSEALRLQAQATQAAADLTKINGEIDLLETKFKQLSVDSRVTMLEDVMKGHVAIGATGQIPEEIAVGLAEINQIMFARGSSNIVKVLDRVTDLFKSWAIASIGFHSRNFMGGIFNNALAGVDAASYKRFHTLFGPVRQAMNEGAGIKEQILALRASPAAKRASRTEEGQRAVAAMEEMIRYGVLSGGQTTELQDIVRARGAQSINPLNPNNVVVNAARKPTTTVENYLRGTLAMDRLMNGSNITTAVSDVYKYHFDYADLSAFERGVIRRVIPFYTWTRKNLPLQLEMMLTNPKIYNRMGSLKREIERDAETEEYLPNWINERFNIQMPFKIGGDNVFMVPDLPFTEIDTTFNPRTILTMTSPTVKVPFEFLADYDTFFQSSYNGRRDVVPNAWRVALGPFVDPLTEAGIFERNDRGALTVESSWLRWTESFLPVAGTLRRLIPTSEDPKTEERYLQNIVNWISPIAFRRITERDQRSERLRRENPNFFS